jgi:Iap family predicted aminopeptidase
VPVNITQGPERMSVIYADKPLQSNLHTIFVIVHERVTRMCGQKQCTQVMRCELVNAIRKDLTDYGIPPKMILTRLPGKCSKK